MYVYAVAAMKGAAAAMKTEHGKIDIGEIEDLQDDLEDMMYLSEEVTELMGRSYGCVRTCVSADIIPPIVISMTTAREKDWRNRKRGMQAM